MFVSRDVEENLPFLVSQSSVVSIESGTDQKTNPLVAFPMENTLLYTGLPVSLNSSLLGPEGYQGLGDVLVEPFAWPSTPLEKPDAAYAGGELKVRKLQWSVNTGNLGEWMGAGTSMPSAVQAHWT